MSAVKAHYKLEGTVDDDNDSWTDFELHYKEGKLPILVDIYWTEEEGSVGSEEIEEFLEKIGSLGLSRKKRKVIKHLRQSKFIVCNQLPTSDIDDDGYDANGELLQFSALHYGE